MHLVRDNIPHNIPIGSIDIWFQDESRIGQKGTNTRCWIKKGTRKRLLKQGQHISTYMFGAVCPSQKQTAALVLPECNMQMMELFLEEIAKQVPAGRHAVVLLDRASWHTSQKLQYSPRITLLSIPPYSPELNPVEQIWQWLKQTWLSNRVFKDLEEIIEACRHAWLDFLEKQDLEKMCSREWAVL